MTFGRQYNALGQYRYDAELKISGEAQHRAMLTLADHATDRGDLAAMLRMVFGERSGGPPRGVGAPKSNRSTG